MENIAPHNGRSTLSPSTSKLGLNRVSPQLPTSQKKRVAESKSELLAR
jgi:hypothetical protein